MTTNQPSTNTDQHLTDAEKRLLTPPEIEYILDECTHRGLTREQNSAVTDAALQPIRQSLSTAMVYPAIIPQLKTKITQRWNRSRVEPGNCVGITQGQVLGEDQTQAELNKFHQAGAGVVLLNGISGVPRFNEILVASTKPKGQLTSVYFKNPPKSIAEARGIVGTDIQQILLENLAASTPEYEYSATGFQESWYEAFEEFFEDFLPENFTFENTRYRVKICLDGHSLLKWGLTEIAVVEALESTPDIVAIFSPTNLLEIHVFVEQEFREVCWSSEIHQYYSKSLATVIVAGIPHVEALHFMRVNDDSEEWMALCEGERITRGNTVKTSVSRFIGVLSLDYVDQFMTVSNNVWDIATVYGIEAVRELMIYEFLACGGEVEAGKNTRHVELLVDIMLFTGKITAVSKNGVNPDTAQILLRVSFEQIIPQFTTAAVHTESDDVSSISAGMICGSICGVGTAVNGLIMHP